LDTQKEKTAGTTDEDRQEDRASEDETEESVSKWILIDLFAGG
jgi:hypothetical protein